MNQNVGRIDRIARFVIALVGLGIFAVVDAPFTWIGLVVAAIMGITAAMSSCPLYMIAGFSTADEPEAQV